MPFETAPLAAAQDPAEVQHAQQVAVLAFATLAEQRESDTESHLLRVLGYVKALCQELNRLPAMARVLTPDYVALLCNSVPLYDMGSVGIPDRILLKPGRLTPDELAIMRTHTTVGFDALERAERTLGRASPLLTVAKELALAHHERWDGSGYPRRFAGLHIPLSARIVALADVYDAMTSNKVYKDGVPHARAVELIVAERGAHFDPEVVDAFVAVQDQFQAIAKKHADTDADMQRKIEYMANAIAEIAEL